ncbi:MAG: hemolysin family protein [Oligoflexia bacterium]|nr:hemolysin family protein [Oligoflexia bacterium]
MAHAPELASTLIAIAASLVLVALNGFFVAAEFAIVKVRRTRLEELADMGVHKARISILCVDQLDEYLSATQLGITLVSLGLGWIGERAFANLFVILFPQTFPSLNNTPHIVAAIISFFLITLLHVVLGELVPKSMAIQKAERMTLWVSKPLSLFYKVSKPLINCFTMLANFILRRLGYHGYEEPALTEQELKMVLRDSKEDGIVSESEAQIINRAFEFSDKKAIDIMVQVSQIDYLSMTRPLSQNLEIVRKHMHTRFPLCETDLTTMLGIVHVKDAWPLLLNHYSNEAFRRCSRPAVFITPDIRQDQILKLLQQRRAHMALVKDNQTKTITGLLTMEDIIERLIGDIRDEHGN